MTNICLVGSIAFKYHVINTAVPSDYDYIAKYDDAIEFVNSEHTIVSQYTTQNATKLICNVDDVYQRAEVELAWEGTTGATFLDLVRKDYRTQYVHGGRVMVPCMEALYALKMSHRYLRNSPHFLKTMRHIREMRKILHALHIDPYYVAWYAARQDETYSYPHPKLNVNKDEFFTDNVPYKYDHDSIHRAVKIFEQPAYTYFLDGPVKVSPAIWKTLPYTKQIAAALEESYVLALERSVIPYPDKVTDGFKQFEVALGKICTSITSGWFREFCWENYDHIVDCFDSNYIQKFKFALKTGHILPYAKD